MDDTIRFSTALPRVRKKSNLIIFAAIVLVVAVILSVVTITILRMARGFSAADVQHGEHLFNRGEYRRALVNFHLPSKENPGETEGNIRTAKSLIAIAWDNYIRTGWVDYAKDPDDYMPSEELTNAINILKDLIIQEPENEEAYYCLGVVYGEKGWFYKAIREYERILERNAQHWDAYNNIGVAYTDLDEFNRAETFFLKIIEKNPEYDRAYLNLAVLYGLKMGDIEKVLPYFRTWEKKHPDEPVTYHLKKELERVKEGG
jgi:tetratricopeptide (TPR) repeat protein